MDLREEGQKLLDEDPNLDDDQTDIYAEGCSMPPCCCCGQEGLVQSQ